MITNTIQHVTQVQGATGCASALGSPYVIGPRSGTRFAPSLSNSSVRWIAPYAFCGLYAQGLDFQNVTAIYSYAFQSCAITGNVTFPNCMWIGEYAFSGASFYDRRPISFPECQTINVGAFQGMTDDGILWPGDGTTLIFNKASQVFPDCFSDTKLYGVSLPSLSSVASTIGFRTAKIANIWLDACQTIESDAFANTVNYHTGDIRSVYAPQCTTIGRGAFSHQSRLMTVSMPNLVTIGEYAFASCSWLSVCSFPSLQQIKSNVYYGAFQNTNLTSLYLMGSSVVRIDDSVSYVFRNTPIGISAGSGKIYVPSSMVAAYRSAQYWSAASNKIVGLE